MTVRGHVVKLDLPQKCFTLMRLLLHSQSSHTRPAGADATSLTTATSPAADVTAAAMKPTAAATTTTTPAPCPVRRRF